MREVYIILCVFKMFLGKDCYLIKSEMKTPHQNKQDDNHVKVGA